MNNATAHCSLCLSTDYEDLHTGDQGYTACCNEPISYEAIASTDADAEAFGIYDTAKASGSKANPYRIVADHFGISFTEAIAAIDRHLAR